MDIIVTCGVIIVLGVIVEKSLRSYTKKCVVGMTKRFDEIMKDMEKWAKEEKG